jgi:hypothetical protein
MNLPIQSQPVMRNVSTAKLMLDNGIIASGCSWALAAECVTAVALCGASCLLGPEVCIPCLAAGGLSYCFQCLIQEGY